jgi:hypothetical protein
VEPGAPDPGGHHAGGAQRPVCRHPDHRSFLHRALALETAWLIGALFVLCMACLIASLALFIHDVNQSLAALRLELTAGETEAR